MFAMSTRWGWLFGIVIAAASFGSANCAQAQIVPDRTLGTEGSRLTPNVLFNGTAADRIEGGAQRGSNLFHSFSQFNVSNRQRVYFVNPSGIQNILTRVTGGQVSNILGTLGVEGSANLFLLNPNGIVFGPNARLDVRGSFLGTTANSFVFPQGIEFSATNPQAPPLLTINVPIGLQFGSQPGRITSLAVSRDEQGSAVDGLSVDSGSSLSLIGGEIALDGSALFAPNGRVQLGAVGGDTTVGLLLNGSSLDFSLPETARRSPITLTNGAVVGTTGDSVIKLVGGQIGLNSSSFLYGLDGGAISINANQLSLDNRSLIATATQGARKAGDIQIQASDAVILANRSQILSNSNNSATGNGGDIAINARTIAIAGDGTAENSSIVSANTFGEGNGGNLTLNAKESVNINGGAVSVATAGTGNAGNLSVQTGNGVNVTDRGALSLFSNGSGSTGNLRIETGTFHVQNSGTSRGVSALANGSGSVGSISIQARDAVEVIDGRINTQVVPGATGRAGDIVIETQRVNLRDGGIVTTDTLSNANAGNIVIRASDSVDIRGVSLLDVGVQRSQVSSTTFTYTEGTRIRVTGNGGDVMIETPRLTLSQGGGIRTTSSTSRGNAGNITIRAKDVELDGFVTSPLNGLPFISELNSQVIGSDADVRGGTITVDTERLRLSNGANLNTSVLLGQGQGGNLVVRASDSIDITGVGGKRADGAQFPSGLFAQLQTEGIGSGGSISVETGRLNISDGGQISTSTFNQGNAGNIAIRADLIDLRGQKTLITSSVENGGRGNAGNLSISTQGLNVQGGAEVISGTFGKGNAGDLTIQADAIELTGAGSGLFSSVQPGANGKGGNLSITSDRLLVRDNANVSSSTYGIGDAGNIRINANSIMTRDSAEVSSSTFGTGNAGNLTIQANQIELFGESGLFSRVNSKANGNGGTLSINTNNLIVGDNASISSSTSGRGQAGDLIVKARDLVEIGNNSSDTQLSSELSTFTAGSGNAGRLTIDTRRLSILNGGGILTTTSGSGRGGDLNINAANSVEIVANPARTEFPEGIFTGTRGSGNAGDLTLSAQRLRLRNGGAVSATSSSTGQSGNVTINALDSVEVAGTSNDGSLPSRLSVRSLGKGTAGNLTLYSRRVTLKDRGEITAATNAVDGGNITLNTDLLLLRNGGNISATAGQTQGAGNGGNITINARAIAAVPQENSDISANAFRGRGGSVTINSDGLFGIVAASRSTPQSDITASSELGINGTVQINTPEVDSSLGLVTLPTFTENTPRLVSSSCAAFADVGGSKFTVTGRSGLPPSPDEFLTSDVVWTDTRLPDTTGQQHISKKHIASQSKAVEILPATGWVLNGNGEVTLISDKSGVNIGATPTNCPK